MLVCLLVLWQGMGWADNDRSNLCHQFYYDINGDGTLEYFDTDGIYSINGKKLYSINCETYSMGLFDKDGHPLLVTTGPKVWDYKTGKFVLDDKWYYLELADIDGDGRKELIEMHDDIFFGQPGQSLRTYHLQNDGTFIKDKMYITEDTTTIRSMTLDNYTPNSSGSMGTTIGTPGGGMFVEAKPSPEWTEWEEADDIKTTEAKQRFLDTKSARSIANNGRTSVLDFNGDGFEDLMDRTYSYFNLGNNTLLIGSNPGSLYLVDLTGNGLLDYVRFKKNQIDLYLNKTGNTQLEKKTLLSGTKFNNAFFYDFDKDGDTDILLLIPGSDYLIFQFYRNDGNGVFKSKDYSIDLSCDENSIFCCGDYDGDGLYEVVYYDLLFKCNKNWTITESALSTGTFTAIGDINNDGFTELISGYKTVGTIPNSKQNTRPAKMEKPTAVLYADAGKLNVSWTPGKDAETSSCDLTYELRIGSESGKGDIFLGKSNADGTRRSLEVGNMGRNLKYLLNANCLSEGKYYIAIQAIDAGGLGGPWSDELVYEHKLSAPIITNVSDHFCTSDTITLTVQNPIATAKYNWELSNGTIISKNENGSIINAVFNRAGTQAINLSMTSNGKEYKATTKNIKLLPYEGPQNGAFYFSPYGKDFFDLNQDGYAEIQIFDDKTQKSSFYEYKDGKYVQIRKAWNLKGIGDPLPIDVNHDGYLDFLSDYDMLMNSGEQDNSFEWLEKVNTFSGSGYNDRPHANNNSVDLNNDGHISFEQINSIGYNGNLITNQGDDHSFKLLDKEYNTYDFNRDGSVDLWRNYSRKSYCTKVYLKNPAENNSYDEEGKVFYESNNEVRMYGFADFNNDGYVDGYFFDQPENQKYYNLVIIKGKPMDDWPCTQTVVVPLPYCKAGWYDHPDVNIVDLDNNGFLDLFISYSNKGYLMLMDKDFQYTITDSGFDIGTDEYHWQPLTPGAYPNGYKSNIKNEAPTAPTHVTATSVPEGLLLKWDDATDDHTPWMQMRYNVSLKIKGKTGENAFVLSPMNGLSDEAAICSGLYYRKATQLIVPKTALVNGTTYELQVQAIDLMGEHSAMTKPVEVTYNAEKMIMIDYNEHYTGLAYYGKCTNVSGNDFTIDPGEDGTVLQHRDGGIFCLKWKTPGVKTITFKDGNDVITKMVNVKLSPDLTMDLPERVMLNTPLTVKVPECFQTGKYDDFGFKESEAYKATFEKGDTIATIVFKEVGEQTLQPYVKIENNITLSEQFNTTVVDETMPTAEIKSVESNGKYYQVNWSTDMPSMVSKVEVSRETNRLNKFEVLDIVPVGNGTYIDLTSDNRVQPQRYRIRLIAENEIQHSDYSVAHNPLHVMINKTADKKGNNLMWNVYEGLEVSSYIIMRGSSEKNLKAIATISGSQQNYTDYDAPAGVSYYAVKFETNTSAGAKAMGRMAASEDVSSNVISSEEAMPTTQATSLYAGTIESIAKLSNNQQQLHMVATILPTYVTFNKVSWSIVSGGEYASISQSGLLTAKGGKGDVVVRVVTLDGSNLSCDITIPCDVHILATDIDVRASKKTVNVGDYLLLNVVLAPKNTTMNEVIWKSENTYVATIDENGIMKAVSAGTAKITATTKDGSNLSAFINITVIDPSGIRDITTKDENENTELYDLEGRKIQVPQKGHIYITNKGQKIAF